MTYPGMESVLLAAVAYDGFVAVCSCLHYLCILNSTASLQQEGFLWLCGLVPELLVRALLMSGLAISNS